jgi:TolB protein
MKPSAIFILQFAICVLHFAILNPVNAREPSELIRLTTDGTFKQRPAFSPDGRVVVFARHGEDQIFLYVLDVESGKERRLTKSPHPEYDATFAPNGQELALTYDKASPNQGDIDVYRVALAGEPLTPVAPSGKKLSHEESPTWSPDGEWIAYTSTFEGNQELYVIRKDGTERRRLTTHTGLDAHPSWSPDGERIAFATDRWGDLEIATADTYGGNVQRITESGGLDDYPAWSPDGMHLAFTLNRDGNLEIYVCRKDGQNARNISQHADIDNFAAWTKKGELGFVSARDGGFDIYLLQGIDSD